MNTDDCRPALSGQGYEFGLVPSSGNPCLAYYLRFCRDGSIYTAKEISLLALSLAGSGRLGRAACYWLLDRDDLSVDGSGNWLPDTMDKIFPGSVEWSGGVAQIRAFVEDDNSQDISLMTFLGRYGWVIVSDDGKTEYQPDRDPHRLTA